MDYMVAEAIRSDTCILSHLCITILRIACRQDSFTWSLSMDYNILWSVLLIIWNKCLWEQFMIWIFQDKHNSTKRFSRFTRGIYVDTKLSLCYIMWAGRYRPVKCDSDLTKIRKQLKVCIQKVESISIHWAILYYATPSTLQISIFWDIIPEVKDVSYKDCRFSSDTIFLRSSSAWLKLRGTREGLQFSHTD